MLGRLLWLLWLLLMMLVVPRLTPAWTALVRDLIVPDKRESALLELSKKREEVPELAGNGIYNQSLSIMTTCITLPFLSLTVLLWYSYGTITALLQEIISIYSLLSPPAKLKVGCLCVCCCHCNAAYRRRPPTAFATRSH